MAESLHHVHIFARDIDATIAWWRDMLGGELVYDGVLAGSRNVFMRIGSGGLHLYDQPPRDAGRGAVHHIGIRSDDLRALVARLKAAHVPFRSEIREFGTWRYIMCAAPDDVLLELSSSMPNTSPRKRPAGCGRNRRHATNPHSLLKQSASRWTGCIRAPVSTIVTCPCRTRVHSDDRHFFYPSQ